MDYLKYFVFTTLTLLISNTAFADSRFSCDTLGLKNAEPLIENMIDRILTIGKIRQRYHICSLPKYSNASAMVYKKKRLIAYDPIFLNNLSVQAGEQHWAKIAVLAHEIGHHIYRHTDKKKHAWLKKLPPMKQLSIERKDELQADQFAGKVLANMGASLSSAQALMRILRIHKNEVLSDHPNAKKRVKAVTQGWNIGCQQVKSECNSPKYKHLASQQTINSPLGKQATPNYSRFMQQAKNLKGTRVNRTYCNLYATLAVQQTKRGLKYQCGFNVDSYSSPWQRAFSPQSNWCMQGSSYATAKEAIFRETKLASCILNNKRKSKQATIHSPLGHKATPNYIRFMQQAKKLTGIKVNQRYCNLYASLAIQQTRRNKQYRCGFDIRDTANRWSYAAAPQSKWCMTTRSAITANEAKFRETKLASCIP